MSTVEYDTREYYSRMEERPSMWDDEDFQRDRMLMREEFEAETKEGEK